MEKLIIHPLSEYKDPNAYLIIEFVRDELFCYFKCLNKKKVERNIFIHENFLGLLQVEGLISIKHNRYTKLHLYPTSYENIHHSYYYEVLNSSWVNEIIAYKNKNDPDWRKYDQRVYRHFILENYEYWVEIIASNIKFKKVKKKKNLLKLWDSI